MVKILKCICQSCGLIFEQALGTGDEFVYRGVCPRCGSTQAEIVDE